jgi:hypothetical protein
MANNKTAVVGVYSARDSVGDAIDALVISGFQSSNMSVLLPGTPGSKTTGTEEATKAPEGVGASTGSDAVLGGALGLLAGIGALAVPGVGSLIAAGPIVSALGVLGIGGVVGGVAGALVGMGIPDHEAKHYEGRLQRGGILLSAHCDTSEEIERAMEIMVRTGAEDISSTGKASVGSEVETSRPATHN